MSTIINNHDTTHKAFLQLHPFVDLKHDINILSSTVSPEFYALNIFLIQATFKGWMDIMYAAIDSRNVSRQNMPFKATR